jgi:hypothetical protein
VSSFFIWICWFIVGTVTLYASIYCLTSQYASFLQNLITYAKWAFHFAWPQCFEGTICKQDGCRSAACLMKLTGTVKEPCFWMHMILSSAIHVVCTPKWHTTSACSRRKNYKHKLPQNLPNNRVHLVDWLWWGETGGVVVSVLATGPKLCGFETDQGDGFFKGDKNPQHTFLSDGK